MAINPSVEYPGKTILPSAAYPAGAAQDVTVPNDGTGTPLLANWLNDIWGSQQALFRELGAAPNGNIETAETSQILQSIYQAHGGVAPSLAVFKTRNYQAGALVRLAGDASATDAQGRWYFIVGGIAGAPDDFLQIDLDNGNHGVLSPNQVNTLIAGDGIAITPDGLLETGDQTFTVDLADGTLAMSGGQLTVGVLGSGNHGNLSGGSLHAAATGATAGFLSAADKTKLDNILPSPSGLRIDETFTGSPYSSVANLSVVNGSQYWLVITPTNAGGASTVVMIAFDNNVWTFTPVNNTLAFFIIIDGAGTITLTGGLGFTYQLSAQIIKE